jgi:hypothetical protein
VTAQVPEIGQEATEFSISSVWRAV